MESSTGGVRRQVQDQRLDLGAQEVVRAGRAQRTQPRVFGAFEEVQDGGVVAEVPDDAACRVEASPRITGARAAALARRSASGRAA